MTERRQSTDREPLSEQEIAEVYDAIDADEIDEARARVDAWLRERGDDPDARLLLAACQAAAGEDEAAIATLRALREDEPDWAAPALTLARALHLRADSPAALKEALDAAEAALAIADTALDHGEDAGAGDTDEGPSGEDVAEALICKAAIELDLDRRKAARATLAELPPPEVLARAPALALEAAELLLELGALAEARACGEALVEGESLPVGTLADAWYLLGCVAEREGDEEDQIAAWLRTRELDAEDDGREPLLSEDEVVAVAEAALAELPEEARRLLDNVPVLVADLPPEAEVEAGLDPRVLGMFAGTPRAEDSVLDGASGAGLKQIFLFRRNLDRVARDPDELREEVRTTLLHETGHYFGLDEAALARLGLD